MSVNLHTNLYIMATKGPKPWKLTEDESFTSFTSWQYNIVYTLNKEEDFKPFLKENAKWEKLTSNNPTRGLTDTDNGLTKEQKVANLSQMLGLITQWVPHLLANDIVRNSVSIDSIWQIIRKYYGFQQSESQFMRFSSIVWQDGERPEHLYQRLLAHLQDNLLSSKSKLKHDGVVPEKDEDMSPTVERLAVLRWMELLHPSLPTLVQRTFSNDLQRMTLKDLQPQIVDALEGFLEELKHEEIKASRIHDECRSEEISASRVYMPYQSHANPRHQPKKFSKGPMRSQPQRPQCRLCKAEGRPYWGHTLVACDFVPKGEKRQMIRSYRVETSQQHTLHEDEYSNLHDDFETLAVDEDE